MWIGDVISEGTATGEGMNCPRLLTVQLMRHCKSKGKWNTSVIKVDSSLSGPVLGLMMTREKSPELYFTISGTREPLLRSMFMQKVGRLRTPGCQPSGCKCHSVKVKVED